MFKKILMKIRGGNNIFAETIGQDVRMSNGSSDIGDVGNPLSLTIHNAVGGKVVRFHTYDPITDRHRGGLYIINDDENLGEQLSMLITRESLSR